MKILEELEVGDPVVVVARGEPFLSGVVSSNELEGVRISKGPGAEEEVLVTSDLILTGDIEFRLLDYTEELRRVVEGGE